MIEIKKKSRCNGCHACYNVCPKKCIRMVKDEEGFLYPSVDRALCVECGLCNRICPVINGEKPQKTNEAPEAYAAYNRDDAVRFSSSSGGLFSVLAAQTIEAGGVVFGAAFDEKFDVYHTYADTMDGVNAFRTSKYVQSKIGDSYAQAEKFLKDGRRVLFSGTPCQIGGLLAFLRKDYDNLLTQDFICHGVPSPDVWGKYKAYRQNQAGAKIVGVNFRDKSLGWSKYRIKLDFDNGESYVALPASDSMMKAFLNDLSLRPSCFDCAFKGVERSSDLTLADYWGVDAIEPDMYDGKGTSLIFVHTQKGREILETVKQQLLLKKTDVHQSIRYNASAIKSVNPCKNRAKFLKEVTSENFDEVVNKYCKKSILKQCFRRLKQIVKKLIRVS